MIKNAIIIALVIALIYFYYQQRQKPALLGNPTDPNYQQTVSETIANLKEENEDLETERDKAIREKRETEQQLLAINNRLNNKVQETKRKEEEIERLKSEKNQLDRSLNNKLSEQKNKYSAKVKQLDEEQLAGQKSEEEKAKLEQRISQLTTEYSNLLREINKHSELDEFSQWLAADENRKLDLPEWDKIINEVKQKANHYHLQKGNWKSGWLKNNQEYWEVFQEWLNREEES